MVSHINLVHRMDQFSATIIAHGSDFPQSMLQCLKHFLCSWWFIPQSLPIWITAMDSTVYWAALQNHLEAIAIEYSGAGSFWHFVASTLHHCSAGWTGFQWASGCNSRCWLLSIKPYMTWSQLISGTASLPLFLPSSSVAAEKISLETFHQRQASCWTQELWQHLPCRTTSICKSR